MNDISNARHRVMVDESIFGHRVIGSLTGREISTPDTHKPMLVEVAVMRTDDGEGLVWVPKDKTETCSYEVEIMFHQEDFASPTEAVLGMIAHLRHAEPGELAFNVRCIEDNVTYSIMASRDQKDDVDAWSAWVTGASEPVNGKPPKPRPDLVPDDPDFGADPDPSSVDAMVALVEGKLDGGTASPHSVAVILREAGHYVNDATVLQVHDIVKAHRDKGVQHVDLLDDPWKQKD